MGQELEGSSQNQVEIDVLKHPSGVWTLDVKLGQEREKIPVYHVRENSHKIHIAKALVSGEPVVAFGIGNYGLAIGVEDPRRARKPDSWRGWWDFKPERPFENKVPIMMPWKYWSRVVDKSKIHSNIRPLFEYEKLKQLYSEGIVFHIKAESFDDAPYIDERCFIQVEDGKKMVSVLFWDDPDMYEISDMAVRLDPQVLVGISSYNPHKENPAFNFEEVIEQVQRTGKVPFKYIVRDEVGEAFGVESSMSIFVIEGDHFYEQRRGSISPEKFLSATHLNSYVRTDKEPKYAARSHPKEAILDDQVKKVQLASYGDYYLRRKR